MSNKALIVYFSGTGGTKRVANSFHEKLLDKKFDVIKHSLDRTEYELVKGKYNQLLNDCDVVILLYPVYACEAPISIYEWIDNLPDSKHIPTVVISVSGGGDVWPNTSCRVNIIKALEGKNYDVVYEKMMVMPANLYVEINDHLIMHLIKCIPAKVDIIVNDVLAGKKRRDGIHLGTRAFSLMHLERKARAIGKSIRVNDFCSACGWCVSNCPMGNFHIKGSKPTLGNDCVGCFRCIYGCPTKSIYLESGRKVVFKDGFNLNEVEKRMEGVPLKSVEECCKGFMLKGVKKYLLENE